MFAFKKKKKKKNDMYDVTGDIIRILDEHLGLISKNQERINGLLEHAEVTNNLIIEQKEAFETLQDQVNELQKLVNQNEES